MIFSVFIVYGTILPFNLRGMANFHHKISEINWIPFLALDGSRTSISDVIQNILLFIPIGFFGWLSIRRLRIIVNNSIVVLFYGALLSFSVEFMQLFTTDRTTSLTDLITNMSGTLVGIYLAIIIWKSWKMASHQALIIQSIKYPLFTTKVFLSCLICAHLLQPFDFALDLSSVLNKIRYVSINLYRLSFSIKDDPFIIVLFSTLSFLVLKFAIYLKMKIPFRFTFLVMFFFVLFLESLQFIVKSRSPQMYDILLELTGIGCGFLFFSFCRFKFYKPDIVLKSGFLISFLCYQFCPLKITFPYIKFNLIPFLMNNSLPTMVNLSKVIDVSIIYSFAGYIFHKFYGKVSRKKPSLIVALLIISALEALQGWRAVGNPDITNIIIGFLTFVFGRLVCENEEVMFIDNREF